MTVPRPFLKWAGGKTKLLLEIREHVPTAMGRYFEPFVGGGAVFFDLQDRSERFEATLSDTNGALMITYQVVRDEVDELARRLRAFEKEYLAADEAKRLDIFLRHRTVFNGLCVSRMDTAAELIFLNKTCFNGLYRTNLKGEFNVPHGRYEKPAICDEENLGACSGALDGVTIEHAPFYDLDEGPRPGDFVYCDPPYWPVSKTANFTAYGPGGFGADDQRHLCSWAAQRKADGVRVLLSNADVPEVRELYVDFEVVRVEAARSINSKGSSRGKVGELLIK